MCGDKKTTCDLETTRSQVIGVIDTILEGTQELEPSNRRFMAFMNKKVDQLKQCAVPMFFSKYLKELVLALLRISNSRISSIALVRQLESISRSFRFELIRSFDFIDESQFGKTVSFNCKMDLEHSDADEIKVQGLSRFAEMAIDEVLRLTLPQDCYLGEDFFENLKGWSSHLELLHQFETCISDNEKCLVFNPGCVSTKWSVVAETIQPMIESFYDHYIIVPRISLVILASYNGNLVSGRLKNRLVSVWESNDDRFKKHQD